MVNSAFFFLVTVCIFVILFVVCRVFLSFCLFISALVCLLVCLSAVSVCLCLLAFLFPCLSVSVCHCLFAFLISVSVCLSVFFISVSVCFFFCLPVCLHVCLAVVTVGGLVATFKDGYARSLCTSVHMVMNISCSCYVCFPLSNRQFVRLCLFTTCLSV